MTSVNGPDRNEIKKPTGDYEVGYRRPPKEHQCRKGQSGNPKGRPRGSRSFHSLLGELFRRRTTIRIGGTEQRVAMSEALALAAVNKGLKGDIAALKLLFGLQAQISEQNQTAGARMTDSDLEILADLQRRLRDDLQAQLATSEARQ